MKSTDQPKEGKLYFTKDGQGDVRPFNEGSNGNILPITVSNQVWITNHNIVPIARHYRAIAETIEEAKLIHY